MKCIPTLTTNDHLLDNWCGVPLSLATTISVYSGTFSRSRT